MKKPRKLEAEPPWPAPPAAAHARLSRREFLQSTAVAVSATGLPLAPVLLRASAPAPAGADAFPEPVPVVLEVNGRRHELRLEPRVTLLDALRESLGLTGTKKGCDHGQCGACTVLADGRRINACLTLAIMHENEAITTVEGLAPDGRLSPLQAAFIACDAFQCGYCTPGQLCSATALLAELRAGQASAVSPDVRRPRPVVTEAELRERMSGNLCRCGAYPNILAALRKVAG